MLWMTVKISQVALLLMREKLNGDVNPIHRAGQSPTLTTYWLINMSFLVIHQVFNAKIKLNLLKLEKFPQAYQVFLYYLEWLGTTGFTRSKL